jgi:tRNA 2-thiouridine synthesizing protein A
MAGRSIAGGVGQGTGSQPTAQQPSKQAGQSPRTTATYDVRTTTEPHINGLVTAQLDITHEVCPMTFVRVKLALEKLQPGDELEVRLKGEEPLRNVPKSARKEGHEILSLEPNGDGTHLLRLKVQPD